MHSGENNKSTIEILSVDEEAASPLPGYQFQIFNTGTRLVKGLEKQNL